MQTLIATDFKDPAVIAQIEGAEEMTETETYPINGMCVGKELREGDRQTTGVGEADEALPTLQTSHHHAVAQVPGTIRQGIDTYNQVVTGDVVTTVRTEGLDGKPSVLDTIPIEGNGARPSHHGDGYGKVGDPQYCLNHTEVHGVAQTYGVRRITPLECERLMGFKDNWTRVPWKGKPAEDCPDAPRYKACGNSMSVNSMEWIGMSIAIVDALIRQTEELEAAKTKNKSRKGN